MEDELLMPAKAEEVSLPDVPSGDLPKIPNATKAELKQLEAELAGL